MMDSWFRWTASAVIVIMVALLWSSASGVQPQAPQFHTSHRCVACHNGMSARNGEDISFGLTWRPTMMANSARDPYWQASVRREIMDHPESREVIEDECSTCHMPMARYESKQAGNEGRVFAHLNFLPQERGDMLAADGVSCSLCHQIANEKLGTRESFTGGFVIGGPDVRGNRAVFGPYAPDEGHTAVMQSSTGGFRPTESIHIRNSEVCATCHTLITKTLGPGGKVMGEFPEQVPYLEWMHSAYRNIRSCQSCHMPVVLEEVPVSSVLGVSRTGVARHTFVGGNFFMKGILNRHRSELRVEASPADLTAAAQRTQAHLQTQSARLSLATAEIRSGRLEIEVSVENLAGHKLPTAYPSRRVWLHTIVRDKDSRIIFESGALSPTGAIAGNDNDVDATRFEPHYEQISDAGQVQIYEAILADGNGAVTTGLLQAISYLKDNRLLPRGFDKKTAGRDVAVAGAAMKDEDFRGGSDRVRYSVDLGKAQAPFWVEVELCYQPVSYRWAMNLKSYAADETRRFTRYFEEAAPFSKVVLARTERKNINYN